MAGQDESRLRLRVAGSDFDGNSASWWLPRSLSCRILELLLVGRTSFRLSSLLYRPPGTAPIRRAGAPARIEAGKGAFPSMAAPHDRPGEPSSEGQGSETSTHLLREQSQLDFELEFLGRILERDPCFADVLQHPRQ